MPTFGTECAILNNITIHTVLTRKVTPQIRKQFICLKLINKILNRLSIRVIVNLICLNLKPISRYIILRILKFNLDLHECIIPIVNGLFYPEYP